MAFSCQSTEAQTVATRGGKGHVKANLNSVNDRLPIFGLEQSSFSYGLPDGITNCYCTCSGTSIKEASSLKLLSERGYMISLFS
jgi:hypothetical protein